MKNQLRIPFESINWDLFCKRGALLACFDRKQLVLGMGESLEAGEISFFQQDFFNERVARYTPETLCYVDLEDIRLPPGPNCQALAQGDCDDIYLQDLRLALNSFDETLQKVVLISREFYARDGCGPLDLLRALLKADLGYHYGIWDEQGGIMGSTPEILLNKRGEKFETMALAATRPYEKRDELFDDDKELYEHRLVIEDIRDKLSEEEDVAAEETGIERFGALAHLRTDISFRSAKSAMEVVKKLSPTAALGGYPKDKAREFIRKSNYQREFPDRKYGGVVGLENGDDAFADVFALVAIRNIQWDKNSYWIETGGGVVPGSTLENELAEVRRKRNTVRELFFGASQEAGGAK